LETNPYYIINSTSTIANSVGEFLDWMVWRSEMYTRTIVKDILQKDKRTEEEEEEEGEEKREGEER